MNAKARRHFVQVAIGIVPCRLSVLLACVGANFLAVWASKKACEAAADLAWPGLTLLRFRLVLIVFAMVWIASSGVVSWLACRRWAPPLVVSYNIAATVLALTVVCLLTAFGLMGVFAPLSPYLHPLG